MELTEYQKARIEKNRQRALLLRSTRIANHPYAGGERSKVTTTKVQRSIDTGGGFLIDADDFEEELNNREVHEEPAPIIDGSTDKCIDCQKKFSDSKLQKDYGVNVCDGCRGNDTHKLITRTEAKDKYCLKNCDLDMREPVLRFIVRKNPRDDKWGDMKLYLESQVRERSLVVWGDEEKLQDYKDKLEGDREKKKLKKYEKRVKDMRQSIRTSTWQKDLSHHTHEYDSQDETYDEEEDMYSKKCKTCDHVLKYEKM